MVMVCHMAYKSYIFAFCFLPGSGGFFRIYTNTNQWVQSFQHGKYVLLHELQSNTGNRPETTRVVNGDQLITDT